MSAVQVHSSLFGTIEAPADHVFFFAAGIPGLEEPRSFTFLDVDEYAPLVWMVSTDGACHFPVLPVSSLTPGDLDDVSASVYVPQLLRMLEKRPHAVAYVILKIAGPVKKISLKAPILVDHAARTGEQIILDRFEITSVAS